MHGLCNTHRGRGPPSAAQVEVGLGALPSLCRPSAPDHLSACGGSEVAATLPSGSACLQGALVPRVWAASGSDQVQHRGGRGKPLLVPQSAEWQRKRRSCLCVCLCMRARVYVCSGPQSLQVSAEDVPPPCLSHTESNRLRRPGLGKAWEKLGARE